MFFDDEDDTAVDGGVVATPMDDDKDKDEGKDGEDISTPQI
jgi:hypothetical protein